jgi:hypothetical protein
VRSVTVISLCVVAVACVSATESYLSLQLATIELPGYSPSFNVPDTVADRIDVSIPTYGNSCVEPGRIVSSWIGERILELRPMNWMVTPGVDPDVPCLDNINIHVLDGSFPLPQSLADGEVLVRVVGTEIPGGDVVQVERAVTLR